MPGTLFELELLEYQELEKVRLLNRWEFI